MSSEYDRKFQEMKMYIPFLESMIKRLENTSTASSNPRQAQLDKIRSLRDLLLDKKKRMKMENLLKCEQVLVNLYAKVEQRDGFSEIKPAETTEVRSEPNLEAVRNKLKAVTKIRNQTNVVDTLPEIARASQTEEAWNPGSKEPALFQRRPHKTSSSPQKDALDISQDKSKNTTTKRNYTRVLLSPEPSVRRKPSESPIEESLFSRRSPRRSPRRHSPTYNKKERKKTSKDRKSRKMNITLNVPEKSLESLNTSDILSRIINCSDRDVDIDTLRELRSQILGELKQTGSNEDISDFILKSYKKEKKSNAKKEVEEGELSDSESEAIGNIYGSLVVEDKDQEKSKTAAGKRKIQISLVIDSEKKEEKNKPVQEIDKFDLTGSDTIDDSSKTKDPNIISLDSDESSSPTKNKSKRNMSVGQKGLKAKVTTKGDIITIDDDEKSKSAKGSDIDDTVIICDEFPIPKPIAKVGSPAKMNQPPPKVTNPDSFDFLPTLKQLEQSENVAKDSAEIKHVANFYKPINEETKEKLKSNDKNDPTQDQKESNPKVNEPDFSTIVIEDTSSQLSLQPTSTSSQAISISSQATSKSSQAISTSQDSIKSTIVKTKSSDVVSESSSAKTKPKEVSEIDILQALKNEILNETIPIATPEADTPALHQPKLTKVASAKEILPKKRISIENYKQKSAPITNAKKLFVKEFNNEGRDKKQSLKLTEKEWERLLPPSARLSLDDEQFSDDDLLDDNEPKSPDDIYSNLAPKSPDHAPKSPDHEVITSSDAPVIIPTDPVKTVAASSKVDVDMRALPPLPVPPPAIMPLVSPLLDVPLIDPNITRNVIDPRMRKDAGPPKASPHPFTVTPEMIPGPPMFPPLMTPSYTPNFPPNMTPRQMTPNPRSLEMTPSHSSLESDDPMARKHVYAPTFSAFDRETSVSRDSGYRDNMGGFNDDRRPQRDDRAWDDRNVRATSVHRESSRYRYDKYQDSSHDQYVDQRRDNYPDSRHDQSGRSRTDKYREQRYDKYQDPRRDKYADVRNDKYHVDRREYSKPDATIKPFGWSDCPSTPSSAFGRNDGSLTPSHPFGRSDCPATPSHPFGRSDCPATPSQPFGRSDCPTTPVHPFGRSDCPTTPVHPFGRSDCPTTPVHPFGRSDGPTTPVHPFGRSDCPTTPVHPFGRSDCPTTPSHQFGRTEASKPANPLFRKDPRLIRRTEVDSRPQAIDRERGFQGDRQYGGSFQDQKGGHQSRYYDRERQSISRDTESERYSSKVESHKMNFDDIGSRRPSYGQQGFGRSIHDDNSRNYRAASVGRRTSNASDSDNQLSIKSRSGRSFVIDTSVNNTFQKLIESKGIEVFDYSFAARRQRASSVGRSMARENSVGRTVPRHFDHVNETKNDRMKRASSVGRDLLSSDKSKSLRDLKAEFQAFRARIVLPSSRTETERNLKSHGTRYEAAKSDYRNSKRDSFQQHSRKSNDVPKPSYSPRKNARDPRMRRDPSYESHNRSRSGNYSRDRRQSGIVYSNDNIAKGTIMGTGFGVRNYKIPKIKRPEPEPVIEPEPTPAPEANKKVPEVIKKAPEGSKKTLEGSKKVPEKKPSKEEKKPVTKEQKPEKVVPKEKDKAKNKSANETTKIREPLVESPKRLTRSSKKLETASKQEEVAPKGKKTKKGVLYDSDSDKSDSDKNTTKKVTKVDSPKKVKPKEQLETTAITDDMLQKDTDTISNSSFVIDDMSLFPDTIVSDPVIDNINALIADLDHDIDEKSVSPTVIEQMMESIDSPEDSFGDISEVIQNDLNESEKLRNVEFKNETQSSDAIFDKLQKDTSEEISLEKEETQNVEQNSSVMNNENIVSTTDSHLETPRTNEDSNDLNINKDNRTDQTAPDSTHKTETSYKPEEGLPDSTNEITSQASSVVTSTESPEIVNKEESSEPSSSQKDVSQLDNSIGSLLSILQNKSKLKEILSMLGDQTGDSDKIKKKLEKLSEIVSDDEESNDAESNTDTASKIESPEIKKPDDNLSSENTEILEVKKKDESESTKMDEDISQKEDQNNKDDTVDSNINELSNDNKSDGTKATSTTEEESQNSEIETESKAKEVETDSLTVSKSKEATSAEANSKPKDVPSDIEKDSQSKESDSKDNDENFEDEETEPTLEDTMTTRSPTKVGRKKVTKGVKGKIKSKKVPVKKQQKVSLTGNKPTLNKRKTQRRGELKKLHDDIKEMFISDDVLNATGIRMCRLAKLVEDKNENSKEDAPAPDEVQTPVVVIEKFKVTNTDELPLKIRKKPGPKPKLKKDNLPVEEPDKTEAKKEKPKEVPKNKPGPKSRKRFQPDPYEFDTDSLADTSTTKDSENESESDGDASLASSSQSFGSSEVLADLKKKTKRKRRRWQVGVIKAKSRRKREQKPDVEEELPPKPVTIPDFNCFTDKTYCFKKNVKTYGCRLCHYTGDEIVKHYRKDHPHTEIPLSRIEHGEANEAIKQCEELNFQVISKMSSEKYTCRFCFKEFKNTRGNVLETFFWHVVSTHTGEYKQTCYECVTETRCPFNLDIPPPPKELQKQLIGYICGKCNFTQISLENLKTHVIVRHNDEETEVYTINLSVISKKAIAGMLKRSQIADKPRVLRSNRSTQSATEASDDASNMTESEQNEDVPLQALVDIPKEKPFKSKIFFESDDVNVNAEIKVEQLENEVEDLAHFNEGNDDELQQKPESKPEKGQSRYNTDNIMDCAHFRVHFNESGAKVYVCCINDNIHYKTSLLISMKRHVQSKHSDDNWDGYCSLCKVIVTLQGVKSNFKDCLDHYLSKHSDEFPVAETLPFEKPATPTPAATPPPKPYITVRPLAELIAKELKKTENEEPRPDVALPTIETIESPGNANVPVPTSAAIVDTPLPTLRIATPPVGIPSLIARMSPTTVPVPPLSPVSRVATPPVVAPPTYPVSVTKIPEPKPFEYEEVQADVMSKKYPIVLEAMMAKNVLVKVFKCAGRFCSFSSDSAEDALLHASAHQRVGGEDALKCTYCNFDASENAIDLVMHVFKEHANCIYCCGLCFYRAASVQLVVEHFGKMHGSSGTAVTVLRNAALPPNPPDNKDILTREQAVPYYICKINEGSCKFRSYIPAKFAEHVTQKHSTATSHPCYICETSLPSCIKLVEHMKGHSLRLYQCTWCVFGASDESGFISHVASVHPNKLPQAYLRIITVKDGTTDMRVLPLVNLNKSKVAAEDIQPSDVKENPVKVAERSVDLEKLIGQANILANPSSDEPEIPEPPKTPIQEETIPKDPETPTVPIKSEPEPEPEKNISETDTVICLDSDDEILPVKQPEKTPEEIPEMAQTSSPASLPTTSNSDDPKQGKMANAIPLKCPFCLMSFKGKIGLTRHYRQCKHKRNEPIQCPHSPCNEIVANLTALYQHYESKHSILVSVKKRFLCQLCQMKFETSGQVQTHIKETHFAFDKCIMHASLQDDGSTLFTVVPSKDDQKAVKRKSSTETPKKTEPQKRFQPDTPKKYGINDIDKLPITPILDSLVYCDLCEFSTKVRQNMIRHLQLHAANQFVPQTEPVNPVPHLETNEKHFDKMVNLASSSVVTRAPEKTKDGNPTVTLLIPPEVASQYPRYVPERQRHTCGAKGCTYISVDEAMLRFHWDTLHSGSTDYHCVHCPPHQHLDTSKPLTAAHVIAHLKMHDVTLYACSSCSYYHYKKQAVEKHLSEQHKGGQIMVVREEYVPPPPIQSPSSVISTPTMDLKPWQCGLCQFKSLLRPEVVNHCGKNHHSKMQYKCGYCPFRTSTIENVSKHQSNSHPGKAEDIFYYFYKEGSIPNDDGIPLWKKQTQKSSAEVKSEPEPEPKLPTPTPVAAPVPEIDLNIVKKEIEDTSDQILTIEDLCKKYGEFCPPNGIKYRCCLCSVVMEHTRDDMQSHLYEELSYRRWSCASCSYKAYHRTGLNEHMASHHPRQYFEPTQLPVDYNIEKWVTSFLDYQTTIIQKNKENFAKQKIIMEKPAPVVKNVEIPKSSRTCSKAELEQVFGSFGCPVNGKYCCPKCSWQCEDETEMGNHLESELTKIRWCCTHCPLKFQTYHEAQYHCKSHVGLSARPTEAIRDPTVRTSWVAEVIKSQKTSIDLIRTEPSTSEKKDDENSLLVELYAETANVDEHGLVQRKMAESDEETQKDEPVNKKMNDRICPYCNYKMKYPGQAREHILKHYQLKPFTCGHCDYVSNRRKVLLHMESHHPSLPKRVRPTKIPDMLPSEYSIKVKSQQRNEDLKKVCLMCQKCFSNEESETHMHGVEVPDFGNWGDRVLKCNICLMLTPNMKRLQDHQFANHRNMTLDYTWCTLQINTRFTIKCDHCNILFHNANDVRAHHVATHSALPLKYSPIPETPKQSGVKRKLDDTPKRVAKKSTTKLPFNTVAKKSTTKLPLSCPDEEEFSFYGSKPEPYANFKNITTKMPMFNTIVDIDVHKFSTLLNIDPKVILSDVNKNKK